MIDGKNRGIVAATIAGCALLIASAASAAPTLSVTNAGAINGTTFGLQVNFDGTAGGNAFVQDNTPACENSYYASFFLRNNALVMNSGGSTHQVLRARAAGAPPPPVFRAQIVRSFANDNFVMQVWAFNNAGAVTASLQTFVNTVHKITVEWHRASTPTATDGILRLWKGTNMIGEITNIQNGNWCVEDVQMGGFGGVDVTTTGRMDLDEFVSTRAPQF